jgi:hypothetical protein
MLSSPIKPRVRPENDEERQMRRTMKEYVRIAPQGGGAFIGYVGAVLFEVSLIGSLIVQIWSS